MKYRNVLIIVMSLIVLFAIALCISQINEQFQDQNAQKPNLVIGFLTYPRDGVSTPQIFKRTYESLLKNKDTSDFGVIKIIIIGDDYSNIEEQIRPIVKDSSFNVEILDINKNNALRNMNVPKIHKWEHACTRSIIKLFEIANSYTDYDYLLISSDDDLYINDTLKNIVPHINKYNHPDFLYARAYHADKTILPRQTNEDPEKNVPKSGDTIESGTLYNLRNKSFMNDIIEFRKSRWQHVESCIKTGVFNNIAPEDAELWDYLKPKFESRIYRSVLIPEILVNHDTEQTIMKFI